MSDFVSRMPANAFGQPILPDYRVDDYSGAWSDDVLVVEPVHGYRPSTVEVVAVEFDLTAPAKRQVEDDWGNPLVTLREPDMFDEGRAWWFGPDGVVDVNLRHLGRFLRHLQQYDRFALRAYRVRSYDSEEYLPSLTAIYRTVTER